MGDQPIRLEPDAGTAAALAAARLLRARLAEPLRLEQIAQEVGYSPLHLARLFTRTLHTPPVQFLAGLRFERAKQLLLIEQLPVVDVCTAVGFSSPGTFTRRFTSEVGVAPAALRRLADDLAEHSIRPFRLGREPGVAAVTGTVRIPDEHRAAVGDDPMIWLGLYRKPAPTGRPVVGLLRYGDGGFSLPVVPQAPWLLAVAMRRQAEPLDHLVPAVPLWAGHPAPITTPAVVELVFGPATEYDHPLVTALGSLAFE